MKKYLILTAKLLVITGAMWYLVASGKLDFSYLEKLASWQIAVCCFVLILFAQFICAVRLCLFMRIFADEFSVFKVFAIILKAMFFGTFMLGMVGADFIKYSSLEQYIPGRSPRVSAIFIDRLCGLLGLLFLTSITLLLNSTKTVGNALVNYSWIFGIAIGAAFLFFPIMIYCRKFFALIKDKIPLGNKLYNLICSFEEFKKYKLTLSAALLLSVFVHLISVFIIYIIMPSYADVNFWKNASASSIALLTSLIPLPLGGLGIGENAYSIVISEFSDNTVTWGANVYLTYRFWAIIALLPGGFLYLSHRTSAKTAA